jgi:hypothetical protein
MVLPQQWDQSVDTCTCMIIILLEFVKSSFICYVEYNKHVTMSGRRVFLLSGFDIK